MRLMLVRRVRECLPDTETGDDEHVLEFLAPRGGRVEAIGLELCVQASCRRQTRGRVGLDKDWSGRTYLWPGAV
jgi:hypothetical protein